jgi:hypothetical protein
MPEKSKELNGGAESEMKEDDENQEAADKDSPPLILEKKISKEVLGYIR